MRITVKALLLASALVLVTGLAARADAVTQFEWTRTGAENLPCASDVRWVLSPGHGIENATVGINDNDGEADGHAWTMVQAWDTEESWYITSTEPVALDDEVLLAYTGTADPAPDLTLESCVGAEVPPPTGGGGSTEPPAPTPPTQSQVTWDIGFKITTGHRTNVVAKYRLRCSDGTDTVIQRGRVKGQTPLIHSLNPTLTDATSCHLRVVASDVRPWNNPQHSQRPVVTKWVTQQ
jgi:hypothetical protein